MLQVDIGDLSRRLLETSIYRQQSATLCAWLKEGDRVLVFKFQLVFSQRQKKMFHSVDISCSLSNDNKT